MLFPLVARVLRLASIAISAIAILYFASFALDQTSSASSRQQEQVNAAESQNNSPSAPAKKSGLHEAIDEAFERLASPFSGVMSSANGAWAVHIVDTLLVLAVYGFGLAFVARLLKLAP